MGLSSLSFPNEYFSESSCPETTEAYEYGAYYKGDAYGLEPGYGAPQPVIGAVEQAKGLPRARNARTTDRDLLARFYWNERLQTLLDRPVFSHGLAQRREEISDLLERFEHAAGPVVETIVKELSLSLDQKTILPVDVGGVAGGQKFIHRNLFIKFCSEDTSLNTSTLYGDTHYAQKAASHELKSLNALLRCNVSRLHFPLISLVLCRGYRLMVISKLPIGPKTLIYGSADVGKSIWNDERFGNLIKKASEILNLKPHRCFDESGIPKLLYGPVDLEGHLGADSRLYVCDAARLMPPTLPIRGIAGCHLYKLFRPEFVKQHGPLSSDAFSHFGRHEASVHNREAKNATTRLFLQIEDLARQHTQWTDCENIKELLHSHGINLRFLGSLLVHLEDAGAQRLILIEMVARALKNELFRLQRENVGVGEAEKVCLEFLSRLLCGSDPWTVGWGANLDAAASMLTKYFEFCRLPSYNDLEVVSKALAPLHAIMTSNESRQYILLRCIEYAGIEMPHVEISHLDEPLAGPLKLVTRFKRMDFDAALSEEKSFSQSESLYLEQITTSQVDLLPFLNLALLYAYHGRFAESQIRFEQALERATAEHRQLVQVEIMELGASALFIHNSSLSLTWITSVIAIQRDFVGIESELSASLLVSAHLHLFRGEIGDAEKECKEALNLASEKDILGGQLLLAKVRALLL